MKTKQATVLVTGVGGNVGQGILRIIRKHYPQLRIVGTDIATLTAGHYFCDAFYRVPYCYDESFPRTIIDLCAREAVSLIIPATDYESYHLALLAPELPAVIASPAETTRIFLDKYLTWQHFEKHALSFARSWLPAEYPGGDAEIIVKPREGRGSRNIYVNPQRPQDFDDSYVVQPLLRGQEITTAFYVSRSGNLLGPITFERELVAGMTERCQVVDTFDVGLKSLLGAIVETSGIVGPCNLQSIVTGEGVIVPFEVNCRFSGTSSIRDQFGFPDVVYGVQEYLFGQAPTPQKIVQGASVRIFMDIIYPQQTLAEIRPGNQDSFIF